MKDKTAALDLFHDMESPQQNKAAEPIALDLFRDIESPLQEQDPEPEGTDHSDDLASSLQDDEIDSEYTELSDETELSEQDDETDADDDELSDVMESPLQDEDLEPADFELVDMDSPEPEQKPSPEEIIIDMESFEHDQNFEFPNDIYSSTILFPPPIPMILPMGFFLPGFMLGFPVLVFSPIIIYP